MTRLQRERKTRLRKSRARAKRAAARDSEIRARVQEALADETLMSLGRLGTREGRSLLRAAQRRKMVA